MKFGYDCENILDFIPFSVIIKLMGN